MNKIKLFGLNFSPLSMADTIKEIERYISIKAKPARHFTLSAELISMANADSGLKEIYDSADLLTVDSYVVYYASKLLGAGIPEPVSGSRVMLNFLPVAQKKGYKLYLLGAKREVVEKAVEKVKTDYPGIQIVGWHDGYFGQNEAEVADEIKRKTPDVLFVAMTSPLKERFINNNIDKMNVPVAIGVGGIFDIISGKCRLAPGWVSRLGLEWLYRFIQEPRRMWRRYVITNTKFLLLVLREAFNGSKKNV